MKRNPSMGAPPCDFVALHNQAWCRHATKSSGGGGGSLVCIPMRNAPFVLAGLAGMLIACGQAVGVPDAHDVATDRFQSEVVDANLPDLGADVANTDLPNGSPCTVDAQCASHICVSGPDLVHGCALGCRTDDDCNGQGVAVY